MTTASSARRGSSSPYTRAGWIGSASLSSTSRSRRPAPRRRRHAAPRPTRRTTAGAAAPSTRPRPRRRTAVRSPRRRSAQLEVRAATWPGCRRCGRRRRAVRRHVHQRRRSPTGSPAERRRRSTRSALPKATERARVTSSGMPGRQDAAAHPVRDDRQPERLRRAPGGVLGPVRPHVGADHQYRVPCLARGAGQSPLVASESGVSRVGEGAHAVRAHGYAAEQPSIGTSRNTGPRCGMVASRSASSTAGPILADVVDRARVLRHGRQQRRMVQLLQAARAPPKGRRAPAEQPAPASR